MSWWEIKSRDPFVVCADVDDLASTVTAQSLNAGQKQEEELSDQQRDALIRAARFDASGAYAMSGMTYRLVHRLWRLGALLAFLCLLNLALGGILLFTAIG